ncbi:uncharacterized protein LOC143432394 [Xylocopa sonorina]|uniref:uncharacterized protein LOC143432394 n=1 Tax=Xylocopa sonorina TaxID=1818115 RepID=UPI00403AD05F
MDLWYGIRNTKAPNAGSYVARPPIIVRGDKNDDNALIVEVLVPHSFQCPLCSRGNENICFLSLKDFRKHLEETHAGYRQQWVCGVCDASFSICYAVLCHRPKCKGPPQPMATLEHACDASHPDIRNEKRKDLATHRNVDRTSKLSVWTLQEIETLKQHLLLAEGCKQPNRELHKYIPRKTPKQIGEKRRQLFGSKSHTQVLEADVNDPDQEVMHENVQLFSVPESPDQEQHQNLDEDDIATWKGMLTDLKNLRDICMKAREQPEQSQRIIDEFLDNCLVPSIWISPCSKRKPNNEKKGSNRKKNMGMRAKRRRTLYARCQELYANSLRTLADMILWGTEGPYPPVKYRGSQKRLCETFPPITPVEVKRRITDIKKGTTAGLDEITKPCVVGGDITDTLAAFYNLLLPTSVFPTSWKKNRTTLIPKGREGLDDPNNWRPIIISSLLCRIFVVVLDKRLKFMVGFSVRQKGFVTENGCAYNTLLLNEAIRRSKEGKGGVSIILDIANTFDTVPHAYLFDRLNRLGVPSYLVDYLSEFYRGCTTTINCENSESVEITLRRGVKQGDPISPFLFNVLIGPILSWAEKNGGGAEVGDNTKVPILAFADDVVLMASNKTEAETMLRTVTAGLDELSMTMAANKCPAFQIISSRDTWYCENPQVKVKDAVIPSILPSQEVAKLALKPTQKIDMLSTYIQPHFIKTLIVTHSIGGDLKNIDQDIGQELKRILHLQPSTATNFFYARKSDGGLGFPRLEHVVRFAFIRNMLKMRNSHDPVLRVMAESDKVQKLMKKVANSMRLTWPLTLEELEKEKQRMKRRYASEWAELSSQGKSVLSFQNDPIGNRWLHQRGLLKG